MGPREFVCASELVGAMRAENEFELEENGIDVATGEEEIFFQKIVIVLKPDL